MKNWIEHIEEVTNDEEKRLIVLEALNNHRACIVCGTTKDNKILIWTDGSKEELLRMIDSVREKVVLGEIK